MPEEKFPLKAIADLIVDLHARQLALQSVFIQTEGDQAKFDAALRDQRSRLGNVPVVAALIRQTDGHQIESLARTLRTIQK
jgi:hypothetical protein